MKKIILLLLVTVMLLSLAACGKSQSGETPTIGTTAGREYDETDPAAILKEIEADFAATTEELTEELENMFTAVGSTYEEYQKNKGLIDAWVELVFTESDALFARTKEKSVAYFKLVAADPSHKYSEFCDEAIDAYYEAVYEDAMDEYYEALYDDAMDELYDAYYDGIVEDAYDTLGYEQWSKVQEECYETWSDASSAIYEKWSDASSYFYGLQSEMYSAFCWDDNFDVDAIVASYDKSVAEEAEKEAAEATQPTTEATEPPATEATAPPTTESKQEDTELDPDFKAAMDSYEAFFDEYVEIVKKYQENPTDLSLLTDYAKYMGQYADAMEKMEAWESEDLNSAEMAYYIEVQSRVSKKLLEIA